MLLNEIIAVYSENHTKIIQSVGKMQNCCLIKQVGHIVTTRL
jgi:hypothetical protein